MPHKSFVPSESPQAKDPVTFEVGGYRESSGEVWKETFTALPVAPSGVLDDLATSSILDEKGNRIYNAPSLLAFFEGVLIEPDVIRFRSLTHDKDRIVSIDQLGEIMLWLGEELTGHPTER